MSSLIAGRNMGSAAEARRVAGGISNATLRYWLDRGWISAVRRGPRNLLYDLDSVAAMLQPVGPVSGEERVAIAEEVAKAPDPTLEQIAKLRSIIHQPEEVDV